MLYLNERKWKSNIMEIFLLLFSFLLSNGTKSNELAELDEVINK